ncbi:MAG: LPS export ABC transporter permease LptF [Hyphomicrobiaceae bacterium]|nr:LPS export ABC transporter permease LptF [Hyphomicrobiaceae bacterium]
MTRLIDRYVFRQVMGLFVAMLGVLCAVLWVTTALRKLDLITGQGAALGLFAFLTALSLPSLIMTVGPVALLLSFILVLNRMSGDSELIIISAAGVRPRQIARPFFAAASIVALVIALMSLYAAPEAQRLLRNLVTQVRADLIATVVQDGTFASLENGLTFHIRERQANGVLAGILVADRRDAAREAVYLAEEGQIVEADVGTFLVMRNGSIQRRNVREGGEAEYIAVSFDQYAFDLSQFQRNAEVEFFKPRERPTGYLFNPDPEDPFFRIRPGSFRSELHDRFSAPLYVFAFAAIVLATLGRARTTRQDRALSVLMAIVLCVVVRAVGIALLAVASRATFGVVLLYVVPLGAALVAMLSALDIIRLRMPKRVLVLVDALVEAVQTRIDRLAARRRAPA